MPDTGTGTSQSLERGLAILSAFDSDRPLIGVSELSRELELSRSTAHRYIATLAQLGYLQQDPDSKRYRLGPKVLDLGFSAINSMDVREISAPHLRRLSDETGHTVNLAILDGTDVVYIERCRTAQPGQRRSTSISTWAHASRRTARRWGRRSSPSSRTNVARTSSRESSSRPADRHDHRSQSVPRGAGADPDHEHLRERRGAGLRAASIAAPIRTRARCWPRSTSRCIGRWSRWTS